MRLSLIIFVILCVSYVVFGEADAKGKGKPKRPGGHHGHGGPKSPPRPHPGPQKPPRPQPGTKNLPQPHPGPKYTPNPYPPRPQPPRPPLPTVGWPFPSPVTYPCYPGYPCPNPYPSTEQPPEEDTFAPEPTPYPTPGQMVPEGYALCGQEWNKLIYCYQNNFGK